MGFLPLSSCFRTAWLGWLRWREGGWAKILDDFSEVDAGMADG